MSDKHPAEIEALKLVAEHPLSNRAASSAAMLRTIPALEAEIERMEQLLKKTRNAVLAEREQCAQQMDWMGYKEGAAALRSNPK
jgi:hypothetical protein